MTEAILASHMTERTSRDFKLLCSSCKGSKNKEAFSNTQIKKGDLRRCIDCVNAEESLNSKATADIVQSFMVTSNLRNSRKEEHNTNNKTPQHLNTNSKKKFVRDKLPANKQPIAPVQEINVSQSNSCSHCRKPLAPNSCSQCHKVYYCDAKCQKANWGSHRVFCQTSAKQAQELRKVLSQGGWFTEENMSKIATKYADLISTLQLEDFNTVPERGKALLVEWNHFPGNSKLGINPSFRKIGEKILNGTYESREAPDRGTTPPADLLLYEDEILWAWCFKKTIMLASQKNKPFSQQNLILGLPPAEKQKYYGRDDHIAIHAIATFYNIHQVIFDYEEVIALNIFAQIGQTGFTELHSMARAGRVSSVKFMIEGGMKSTLRDSSNRTPSEYVEESLQSGDATQNQKWADQLTETKNYLLLCAYLNT